MSHEGGDVNVVISTRSGKPVVVTPETAERMCYPNSGRSILGRTHAPTTFDATRTSVRGLMRLDRDCGSNLRRAFG